MKTLGALQRLTPHADTPAAQVRTVVAGLVYQSPGNWAIDFHVSPLQGILVPEPEEPARRDGLWRTTCFELFLRDPESGSYLEFNFSPSGCWAAYRFEAYRQGQSALNIPPVRITSSVPQQFELGMSAQFRDMGLDEEGITAMLDAGRDYASWSSWSSEIFGLSAVCTAPDLDFPDNCQVGISAIIEEIDGSKSYWAMAHPPGTPDFHHPDCFAAILSAPERP